jgi:hypothetical protein
MYDFKIDLWNLMIHVNIVHHLITLFPLRRRKKIRELADVGKTETMVNQGKN